MSELVKIDVDLTHLDSAIRELSAANSKSIPAIGRAQMRLLIRDVINITPPGGGGVTGLAARRRGEAAITGDLFGGREVSLSGFKVQTEGLFIVSSTDPNQFSAHVAVFSGQNNTPHFRQKTADEQEIVSLFTSKDGQVYGVEKQLFRPNASLDEMLGHIARYRNKTTGRMTRAGLRSKTIGRHVFIDKMVITPAAKRTLLKHLHGQVGLLAAGWLPAAGKVGAPAPGWVKRHSDNPHGSARLDETSGDFAFEATNSLVFARAGGVMRRGINSAVSMRAAAIRRQIPNIMESNARRAGL